MQPWKKFWPPKAESLVSEDRSGSVTPPWADWKPDPKNPDEKPWIQWMNDKKFNPALDEERGRQAYPLRKRGNSRDPSPKATVAEGG